MRKIISILAIIGSFLSGNLLYAQSELPVEASSVETFFQIADKLASGKQPTEREWYALFETQGYKKAITETFEERSDYTRRVMEVAFDPEKVGMIDIIMNVPITEILSDMEALLMRVMLKNFLDIKEHRDAIMEQILTIDQTQLPVKASERLRRFLVNPIDSLIAPIPISLICMEPDALSLSGRIVWDCNLFRIQTEEEKVDLMAHEMYHAYRRHFFSESKASNLMQLLNLWNNEGVADLIDKKSVSDLSSAFIRFGLPESYVEAYNEVYDSTPRMLKDLEKVTLSYIRNEISEDQFNLKLSGFIQYGGHPNGYYMTTAIKEAGYEEDLIRNFASPVEFMKLYNKSVPKGYQLTSEFMDYLETIQ